MKSDEFIRKTHHKGTYAGVHFSDATKDAIVEYCKENNIPNCTPKDKLHSTLLYSRKRCPNYEPLGKLDETMAGRTKGFDVWTGQPDEDGHEPNCLVLEFECVKLVERHKELMDEHQATYDFDEYKPHVTFSYDIGDMDANELPAFTAPIEIVEEYGEELDIEWAKNNTE